MTAHHDARIDIPDELWKRLKVMSILEDKSVSDIVVELLTKALAELPKN